MGTAQKRERAIRNAIRTARLEDLVAVLEHGGFECRRSGEGHWACTHAASGVWCNIAPPHGGGDHFVKPTYVRRALAALDASRAAAESNDES